MAINSGYSLWRSLSEQQVIAPYVQSVMLNNEWPDVMNIDSPHRHDSHHDDYFHPSTHAIYGEKALYHMLHPQERLNLPRRSKEYGDVMTPLFGSIYHTVIQQKLIMAGLVKPEDVEVALINEERHWRGHADLIFQGHLVDIKSMNSRSFANIKKPYNSAIYQLHPYMDALGLKESKVLVVEMGMPWGMKEFTVPFEQRILDEIYGKWERVRKAIENHEPPTGCCHPDNNRYCPIRSYCLANA